MANTYTQAYFQLVFSPARRESLIHNNWKDELEKYITGIIKNHDHKLIAIGSMPDHIHIFIGYNVNQTIPKLVETIKTSTTKWINGNGLTRSRFNWQLGYGAFSYAHSQIDEVANYVHNQAFHHRKMTFKEEYLEFLSAFKIEYDDKYLFDFYGPSVKTS
jgi:REP element-mobilizing transposase RayT